MGIKSLKKEQFFITALLGLLFLVIAVPVPKKEEKGEKEVTEKRTEETYESDAEYRLKSVLQTISGVGKVEIFITYEDRGQLVFEKDESVSEELIEESDSGGGSRKTTVLQTEQQTIYDENEVPCIVRELSPEVKGVLVVAQGGGNTEVKRKIESTIVALFGLEKHKISIMKMEGSK